MDENQIGFIIFIVVLVGAFIYHYIKSIFESHGG